MTERISAITGFTLPGMIEEPGCVAGRLISPIPQRGPDASQRMSLAILVSGDGDRLERRRTSTTASFAALRLEVIRGLAERRCRSASAINAAIAAVGEVGMRVDAGADRRAAERQLLEAAARRRRRRAIASSTCRA